MHPRRARFQPSVQRLSTLPMHKSYPSTRPSYCARPSQHAIGTGQPHLGTWAWYRRAWWWSTEDRGRKRAICNSRLPFLPVSTHLALGNFLVPASISRIQFSPARIYRA
ncbi:hypothetical protein BD309DRAFT_630821 [Dichomitus squalens]|nr:hypothetical protein BD309DRAFT_630821 [Dichomitus squalens]